MDPERFRPSVDWANELAASTLWVVKSFAVTAVCLVVVLVLVVRLTSWGRQFWRLTGAYFAGGRQSLPVWLSMAGLLLSAVLSVRISVLISFYTNDLFTSLQAAFEGNDSTDASLKDDGVHGFWVAMGIFAILTTVATLRMLLDLYAMQRFSIRWRVWLTRRVIDDWLGGYAYFRGQLAKTPIDNPDQRIQQDVDIVSVSHRSTVEQHHDRQLNMLGDGTWELDGLPAASRPRRG